MLLSHEIYRKVIKKVQRKYYRQTNAEFREKLKQKCNDQIWT